MLNGQISPFLVQRDRYKVWGICALTDGDAYNIYCISSDPDHCIGPQLPWKPTDASDSHKAPSASLYPDTHIYTWLLFTLAHKHKHLYTSTEFPLHLYHFGPNAIIIFLFFSFHLPACLCICPYVLFDDSLSLRRDAHRPPTASSLWVWCIQHTKPEWTFTIWQVLIWLADTM